MDPSAQSYAPAGRFRLLREAGLHLLAAALTLGVLTAGVRLDQADWHAPFGYDNDSLLILPLVVETVERASPWTNDRLGAPGRQELHDFPVVDHLHFAALWLLGRVIPDPVTVFNVFHVLTYPLATATGLFVLRRLGLSAPGAVCGAVLFAFQPYHWLRGTAHYFLAAYFMIPLTLWAALAVATGGLRGRAANPVGFPVGRRGWAVAVLIAALTSQAGAYYAFFACLLLAVAGVYGWATGHGWRAAAAAGVLLAVITVGGVLAHAPAIPYRQAHGANTAVTRRPAEDAELYALKIAQLLLPVANHNPVGLGRVPLFEPAVVRAMYQAPQYKPLNESDWSPLGLVGAAGFVALLAVCVLPTRKVGPVGAAAALTLGGVLFCGHGGFGAVFNLLVTAQVRCHNRISIYLAFLALFAACKGLDYIGRRRWWGWPLFAGVLALGLWDQTDASWFPDLRRPDPARKSAADLRAETAERWWADRAYFRQVEETLPDGAVFTYPYMAYPEGPPFLEKGSPGKIESYEMVRGYLHTKKLRWSFGAMKYRAVDGWMRTVAAAEPVPIMLERLVLGGFDALLVDRKGLDPKNATALRDGLEQYLGKTPPLADPTGRLVLYDLRPYRAALRGQYGAAGLDARSAAERQAVSVLWLGDFASFEPTGYEWRSHWGGPTNELVFANPTDRPRTVELSCRLKTVYNDAATLRFRGGGWDDDVPIDGADPGKPYTRRLVLPPGETRVQVTCTPAVPVLYTDSRRRLFTVVNFRLAEVP